MAENHARERIQEDLSPVFPNEDIACKTCRNRKKGIIGYKNGYCDAYEDGKPDEVLFDNADCEYYEKGD